MQEAVTQHWSISRTLPSALFTQDLQTRDDGSQLVCVVHLKHVLTALLLATKALAFGAAVPPLPPAIAHTVLVTCREAHRRVVTCPS